MTVRRLLTAEFDVGCGDSEPGVPVDCVGVVGVVEEVAGDGPPVGVV
jgi:hypothetical protein